MAIIKVCGIETEYGIQTPGPEQNPIAASSVLVNAYAADIEQKIGWDFEDETPGNDARGFAREGSLAPMVETHLANTVLTNGARFYVDHAHPEYSTPECLTPLECLVYDKAGEDVLRRAMVAAALRIPDQPAPVVYKNNSDGKGNSYGCHENYMMDRAVPFARVIEGVVPHFVSRTIFTGSGKVGVETPALDANTVKYQISQRAEFFEEIVGLETTLKRPIVNTRDEPHADPKRFRRLHVIVGDANLSEIATLLKVGTTAIVLAMVEDDAGPSRDISLADPVRALHQVSADLSLSRPLALSDGSTATALELQWELFGAARKYAEEHGLAALGDDGGHGSVGQLVMGHWETVLEGLESDPTTLADTLDWVAKQQLLLAYQDRHNCSWDDPRLSALALQYHDLRPDKSIYQRLGLRRLISAQETTTAVSEPPPGTRAWFRGKCLARWPEAVVTANWDSLVFDIGTDPLRRVPMMDPLKGTAEHTGALLAQSTSPADLLERLNS
ncbi:MAG TPA: depupylase/deamidase Dop [Acidimicrobiales bacterium]|nr:depupylase/deamidase Dop [Acidimicrobiales bacterium]